MSDPRAVDTEAPPAEETMKAEQTDTTESDDTAAPRPADGYPTVVASESSSVITVPVQVRSVERRRLDEPGDDTTG